MNRLTGHPSVVLRRGGQQQRARRDSIVSSDILLVFWFSFLEACERLGPKKERKRLRKSASPPPPTLAAPLSLTKRPCGKQTSTAARSGHGRAHFSPLFSPEMEIYDAFDAFERESRPREASRGASRACQIWGVGGASWREGQCLSPPATRFVPRQMRLLLLPTCCAAVSCAPPALEGSLSLGGSPLDAGSPPMVSMSDERNKNAPREKEEASRKKEKQVSFL